MTYLVLDLETDGKRTYNRFCNGLDVLNEDHKIVLAQYKMCNIEAKYIYDNIEGIPREDVFSYPINHFDEYTVCVGQNFKFDLSWVWGTESFKQFLESGGRVWDTMTVEYLLRGQERGEYHLDNLAVQYGGTLKDNRMKDHWRAGKLASEAPEDLLIPYGIADVENTEKVFLGQYKKIMERGITSLVKTYMEAYLCLTEMEYNGMYIDLPLLCEHIKEAEKDIVNCNNKLNEIADINWGSPGQLSKYLFGGTLAIKTTEENGLWKTGARKGTVRYSHKIVQKIFPQLVLAKDEWKSSDISTTYSTKEFVLKEIVKTTKNEEASSVIYTLLSLRKLKKKLDTYYLPYKEAIHPHDGCIHTDYKTHYQVTGRISSIAPPVLNTPKSVKDIFVSRFTGGKILTFDFSQIEVYVAAALSRDSVMIEELKQGMDLHKANAAFLYKKEQVDVTTEERKLTKMLTFGILYGEGYMTMSKRHGLSEEDSKAFIYSFYNKYQGIKEWHKSLESEVMQNKYTENGVLKSQMFMPNGKRYTFIARDYKGKIKFKPTDIKNYPVQGTAADIFMEALGKVFRYSLGKESFKLINAVHDEIVIDCKMTDEDIKTHIPNIQAIMTQPTSMLDLQGLQLKVEVGIGDNWRVCK